MKVNFEKFPIGSKVQSYDKDGYYVMSACGFVVSHLGNGEAMIKTFEGVFFSTIGQSKIHEAENIN